MKTLRFIGMAIVAIIMSVNFAACSDDDEEGNNGNNPLVGTWIDDDGSYEAIIWKFNADGTGIEQLTEGGQPTDTYSFTYTYDAKTTVLTVTYKEDGDLVPTDIDTYLKKFVADSVINGIDDAKWQKHLKTLEDLKVDEYTQLCQELVDFVTN